MCFTIGFQQDFSRISGFRAFCVSGRPGGPSSPELHGKPQPAGARAVCASVRPTPIPRLPIPPILPAARLPLRAHGSAIRSGPATRSAHPSPSQPIPHALPKSSAGPRRRVCAASQSHPRSPAHTCPSPHTESPSPTRDQSCVVSWRAGQLIVMRSCKVCLSPGVHARAAIDIRVRPLSSRRAHDAMNDGLHEIQNS